MTVWVSLNPPMTAHVDAVDPLDDAFGLTRVN